MKLSIGRIIISLCIVILISSIICANESNKAWEEKFKDELFVNLLIEEIVQVNKDWTYRVDSRNKIRVQKKEAKDLDIGEIEIEYNSNYEEIKKIKAFITLPNGKKLKYTKIQDFAPYSGDPMYSDYRIKIISMPNVVPGSIIEWEVSKIVKRPYIKNTFTYIFDLSHRTPVKMLKYQLKIPKSMLLNIKSQNTDIVPVIEQRRRNTVYNWSSQENDKYEIEELMPPQEEFSQEIQISSMKEWKEIDQWYWELIKNNLRISEEMRIKVKELVMDKKTDKEKVQAIIKYIQDNLRYVSMSFGSYNCEPHKVDEIFTNKYGDCKDQTMLAIALLAEAGITSYPCLYPREAIGEASKNLPMILFFDHVILAIELENRLFYADILLKEYRFDETPIYIQGKYVFVINGKGGKFQQLQILEEKDNTHISELKAKINCDGSAAVEQEIKMMRHSSAVLRKRWNNQTEKQRKEYFEKLNEAVAPGGKVTVNEFKNIKEEYNRIVHNLKYEAPNWVDISGDFMSFGLGIIEREDILTKKERIYPIMFDYNYLIKDINTYHIPEGYIVVHIPEDIELKSEFREFYRTYRQENKNIIEEQFIKYKRCRLPLSEYGKMQDYLNKIPQITKDKIMIKKQDNISK